MPIGTKQALKTWRIVVPYCTFAAAWILLSDNLLARIAPDIHTFASIGIVKGLAFVGVSALLLHLLLRTERAALLKAQAERDDLLAREQLARARAESANHSKDELLAIVSHELRTPLTPILAGVELLQSEANSPEATQILARIRENAMQEARMVGDLLDGTYLSSGKMQLALADVDLKMLLERTVRDMQGEASAKGVTLSLEPMPERIRLSGDPARLAQVFRALLDNGLKFTGSGGRVDIAVTMAERDAGSVALVEIRDTGAGVSADLQAKLFEAFEQGDRSATRRFGGLGLGLYLAKSLVELHHGRLTGGSDGGGKGAVFRVELPASVGPVSAATTDTPPAIRDVAASGAVAPTANQSKSLGLSILLVEDNPDTSRLLTRVLKQMGCQVVPAGNYQEAVTAAGMKQFDLLLSDIGLPDRSGWDLMRELGPQYNLPGIAVSGFGTDDDVRRSREAGFHKHLVKPVTFQDLRGVLSEFKRDAAGLQAP